MTLWVASDAPERDPSSYELDGTNTPITGTAPFPGAGFTLVSSGALALPDTANTTTGATGFNQVVPINAANPFASCMLVFPTGKTVVSREAIDPQAMLRLCRELFDWGR